MQDFNKKAKEKEMKGYFQTWMYVSKISKTPFVGICLAKTIQKLCSSVCGHEPSKTEWGYGGGEYADRWCRWCNKLMKVKKEIIHQEFAGSFHQMKRVENEGTNSGA